METNRRRVDCRRKGKFRKSYMRRSNCCGALEVKNVNTMVGLLLPARNLALARKIGADAIMSACLGCHYSLSRAQYYLSKYPKLREKVNAYLEKMGEIKYDLQLMTIHVNEFLYNSVSMEVIKSKVKRPLTGLKVAPYYGCLYTRPKPYTLTGYLRLKDDPERPVFMDKLLEALGAEVVPFEAKTMCCGGPHVYSDPDVSINLEARILKEARRNGAEILVVDCPLGGVAIESNMNKIAERYGEDLRMPVVYFTQLMAFAFGRSPEEAMLTANLTNPMSVLKRYL
ncbi:MAG: CoB--CoM heterodisulfide reductase iron-sulfur subunit B family protein [Sulfolobales archaeon]|nr:CoB--CoM heterodisulfide reductase iron-sulfur subunit B family protein [Sulfolobales archaeon]